MTINPRIKKNIVGALLFILGVIVTIIITKASDKLVPNDPIVVKQYTDTVKVVHEYNLPERISNDSEREELEKKVRNLELLNNYEKQINDRIKTISSNPDLIPNLIVTQSINDSFSKGYTQQNASAYFSSDCPVLNDSKYIDINFDFFNGSIINEIAFLKVNIYRYGKSENDLTYVLEEYYKTKSTNNFIRLTNDLPAGRYLINYGFILKKDLKEKYPAYYMKKCKVVAK